MGVCKNGTADYALPTLGLTPDGQADKVRASLTADAGETGPAP